MRQANTTAENARKINLKRSKIREEIIDTLQTERFGLTAAGYGAEF